MVQTVQAQTVDRRYLIETLGLQLVEDEPFFPEWRTDLPALTELDKQLLRKVRAGFLNLLNYPPLLEDGVRMAMLDPILFIGDFYLSPFHIRSEEPVAIEAEDKEVTIRGKIDTLVLKDQLWVMVIESKRASFSIEAGLAQILAYMLGNSRPEKPSFGLITTGGSFMFLKLVRDDQLRYGTSRLFGTRSLKDLYSVSQIFRRLSALIG